MPEQKAKLCNISLSNDTVTQRIEDLANNLKEQLGQRMEGLGKGAFSIALDESTDISDTVQLLIFIRTVRENFEIGCLIWRVSKTEQGESTFVMLCVAVSKYTM